MKAYDRMKFRGVTLNRRTIRMIRWAEKDCGHTFNIAQGSYNKGRVAASAGTHDGGGVVDIGMWGVSTVKRRAILRSLKRAGFAAWMRTPAQGFDPHIHAVAFGDKEVSSGAAAQRRSYDRGRDGLARDRVDPNPWRTTHKRGFSFLLRRPIRRRT